MYRVGSSTLRSYMPYEFLLGMQPILDVVAILPARWLVQTERELGNLVMVSTLVMTLSLHDADPDGTSLMW